VLRADVRTALDDVSIEHAWSLIERFSTLRREHPRDVVTAASEIVARLERLGIPVSVETPELYLSLPGAATVSIGATTVRAKPMAMSRPTEGCTAPLLHVPSRQDPSLEEFFQRPLDSELDPLVRGRIVVTEGFGMPGKVAHFEALGAAGVVAVNPGVNPHWGICTTVWGTPDLYDLPRKPTIPVVAVNKPDGQTLIAAAQRREVGSISSTLEEGWFSSPIPVVRIPGTREPGPFVLLHGHYDSWDVGVGDNAVGDAALLEIARVLWRHRASLSRSVWIAWWPGHSTGRYAGSTWFADRFAQELWRDCIAQVNCDSPGCRWATEYLDVAWMPESEGFCQDLIREITGKEATGERPYQAGDYSFNNIGITSYFMLLSTMAPADRAAKGYYAVGGCGGNIAWHTEDDTAEIADREILLRDIKVYLAAVMQPANATLAPFDFRRTVAEFQTTLARYQEAAGDHFSFEPTRSALADLGVSLKALHRRMLELASHAPEDPAVRTVNQTLRRLARLLVPINFTTRPAFFHDEAEQIPPLPDLAPARVLSRASADHRGFVVTHLVRGQNRVVAHLRLAIEEIARVL
jgi:hypothetical protein